MQWNEDLSVGIDEIDKQHRILLDYFNLLLDAISMGGRWSDTRTRRARSGRATKRSFSGATGPTLGNERYDKFQPHTNNRRTPLI